MSTVLPDPSTVFSDYNNILSAWKERGMEMFSDEMWKSWVLDEQGQEKIDAQGNTVFMFIAWMTLNDPIRRQLAQCLIKQPCINPHHRNHKNRSVWQSILIERSNITAHLDNLVEWIQEPPQGVGFGPPTPCSDVFNMMKNNAILLPLTWNVEPDKSLLLTRFAMHVLTQEQIESLSNTNPRAWSNQPSWAQALAMRQAQELRSALPSHHAPATKRIM